MSDSLPPTEPRPSRRPPEPPDPLTPLVERTVGLQPWRRVFHAGNGLAVASVLVLLEPPRTGVILVLGCVLAALVALDLARFSRPDLNRLFFRIFRPIASPREARGPASSTWYVLGVLLTVILFPVEVAIPAILVLALADPAASYVGRRWGRRTFGTGTVEGSVVFFVVAATVLAFHTSLPVAGFVAMGTALAERGPWRLDDNLVVPLSAGGLLWIASGVGSTIGSVFS